MTGLARGNVCATCGLDFGSVTAFDRHRVGPHDGDRRCRTEADLLDRGYVLTVYGRLTLAKQLDRGRAFQAVSANPSTSARDAG